ncbi:MAG: DUF1376 domain-containing protein [Pseudomonadota bacterium]
MSGRGQDWYKRFPIEFMDGVEGMGPEMIGIYAYVLDLIYARGGKSPRDDAALAGRIGCSKRKITALLNALIERGKIEVRDGYLTHKHAEHHAKTRRALSEERSSAGRAGGEKSGQSRKNKDLSEASASSKNEAEKRREEKKKTTISLSEETGAREPDRPPSETHDGGEANFREKLLSAIGVDPISGLVGPSGKLLGTQDQMQVAHGWLSDHGLTEDEAVQVVAKTMRGKQGGPPSTFKYFEKPMAEAGQQKQAGDVARQAQIKRFKAIQARHSQQAGAA